MDDPRRGPTRITSDAGYVLILLEGGVRMPEHRYAMEQALKRPLLPTETVHHKNGIRSDNRLENLELWSMSHPAGQRVSDKLTWAKEIIALYDGLPLFDESVLDEAS